MAIQHNTTALREQCGNAVAAGRQYLLSCIENDQFYDKWYGNSVLPPVEKSSSPMLCFFTAIALKESGGIPDTVKTFMRDVLNKAQKGASYGYDGKAPIDADDTAFALRTLIAIGDTVTPEMITEALNPFKCGDSWFTFPVLEYNSEETPPFHYTYTGPASVVGPHPEVHLNILSLMQETGIKISRIPSVPLNNGLPVSYFYRTFMYGTWLFSKLCRGMGVQFGNMKNTVLHRQNDNGSWSGIEKGFSTAQETALALLAISSYNNICDKVKNISIKQLMSLQQKDGSFFGGVLWCYHLPDNTKDALWYAEDKMSIVGTSIVVYALNSTITLKSDA
jgi:hypothetical protein